MAPIKFICSEKATVDWHYIGQIYGGDFAKFCGLLRRYKLYCLIYILCSRAYVSVRFSGNYYTTLLPGPTSSFHTRYKTKFRKKVPFYVLASSRHREIGPIGQ